MTTVAEDLDAVTAHKSKLCVSHLDGEHGDALWAVDAVPDAEVPSVLGHHHVAAGHPLDVRAEAQQRGLHAALDVVQLELGRGGKTDTGVLHCCLHQPPLKSGNQRCLLGFGLCTFC